MILTGLVFTAAPLNGEEPDEGFVNEPFNGEDLEGWRPRPREGHSSRWTVGTARLDPDDPRRLVVERQGDQLINARGHGLDLYTEAEYGDVVIDLEVMVPRGANSGVYVMGEYEVQVLDSYGVEEPTRGDMGAIYNVAAPENPQYKLPGEWQHMRIEFRAPRFEGGRRTKKAVFQRVVLNGRVIHENVEMDGVTPGGLDGREKPRGPIMLQGDHGPVVYRNIRVEPLE